jgi:hypothetical protein
VRAFASLVSRLELAELDAEVAADELARRLAEGSKIWASWCG